MAQLWGLVLPLGYAGVPLAAQALNGVPGGPAYAAAGVEAIVLSSVWWLLQRRGYSPKFNLADFQSLGLGVAAGIAALAVNQLVLVGGASDNGSAAAEAAAIMRQGGLGSDIALFAATALLAPATEELMYRGYLLSSLDRLEVPLAARISATSLLFAAAHLQGDALAQLSVVGAALGVAVSLNGGNLAASFVGHATYNAALLVDGLLAAPP